MKFPKPKKVKEKKIYVLKRTPLKRSTKPISKRGKTPLAKAKKKAWDTFSIYVRTRDALKTTGTKNYLLCITCDKEYPAFGRGCAQAGHFIPGRGNAVLIDERFVNGQCYNCNINLKGNWIVYEQKMIKMWGKEEVEKVKKAAKQTITRTSDEWLEIELTYKELLNNL